MQKNNSGVDHDKTTCFYSVIATVLAQHRREEGLHKTTFSEIAGLSVSGWTKVETGKNAITLHAIHRIAKYFNISPAMIFDAADVLEYYLFENLWNVASDKIPEEDDQLIIKTQEFYNSDKDPLIYNAISRRIISVFNARQPPPAFEYAVGRARPTTPNATNTFN